MQWFVNKECDAFPNDKIIVRVTSRFLWLNVVEFLTAVVLS